MKRYVKDSGYFSEIMEQLKDKFHDTLGHIFVDEILIMIDTEFQIKPPKGKNGEEPDDEAIAKWEDKKKKAWKFDMKRIPQIYQDAMEPHKEFLMVVRQSLVDDCTDAQVSAFLYAEMRKINAEYKIQKPDVNTFSDLVRLLGRPDWNAAYDIPNLLDD